jgi:hypothetical protein
MEQLIVIAVFAICAAACVKILTTSYFMAKQTRDTGNALLAAENGAECFKAFSGDVGKTAAMLGGTRGEVNGFDSVIVYYDEEWDVCGEGGAMYRMYISRWDTGQGGAGMVQGHLFIEEIDAEAESIISFPVAVLPAGKGV